MSEKISFQDFIEKLGGMTGFVAASLTDEYIIDRWPMADNALDGKEAKVLEVRVFNDRKEYKLFRTDIGKEFNLRVIDDNDLEPGIERIKESQYLDIDTKRSAHDEQDGGAGNGRRVYTMGGGQFFLPVSNMNNAVVEIVYYIRKDEKSGEARVTDWRAAGFKEV